MKLEIEKQLELMLMNMFKGSDIVRVEVCKSVYKDDFFYVDLFKKDGIYCSADLDYVLKTRFGYKG